jgi:hypothetical protein
MFNVVVLLATIASASLAASANQKELVKIHAILEKLFVSSTDYPKFCENAAPEKDIKDVRKFGRSSALSGRAPPHIRFLLAGTRIRLPVLDAA